MTTTIRAAVALFDMDGTLVDSTHVVEKTWRGFAERHGLDRDAVLASAHGRLARVTVAAYIDDPALIEAEVARVATEEQTDLDGVVAIPGAADLLAAIPAGRWALVTSANRLLAERRLEAAGLPMPTVLVSAEDVERSKPDPEGFLRGAALLGVPATDAVGFEDTVIGAQAVVASGASLVRIGDATVDRADLAAYPRVADLRSVSALVGDAGLVVSIIQ